MVNRQAKPLWRDAVQPRKAASCSLDVIHPRHFRGRSLRNISIRLSASSPVQKSPGRGTSRNNREPLHKTSSHLLRRRSSGVHRDTHRLRLTRIRGDVPDGRHVPPCVCMWRNPAFCSFSGLSSQPSLQQVKPILHLTNRWP